jgi:hypothetical protein
MPEGDFEDAADWCSSLGSIDGWMRITGDLIRREADGLLLNAIFLPGVLSGMVEICDQQRQAYHPPFYCQTKADLRKAIEVCEILADCVTLQSANDLAID